ncbi:MAG TPA: hypothetical protein VFH76_22905 [Kribbella sp.]|nr:hypothetical protein [Kribbella sp.]
MTTDIRRRLIVFTCFVVTGVTLIPVVMMVLVAFQSDAESMAAKPSFWPSSWHPENLTRAFDLVPLGRYLLNTIYFAAGTTILETVTAALAAYAFARLNFPGRSWLFGIYLATLMIPSQVTLIPQFVLVAKLHGIDTWPGMILPHAFTALGVIGVGASSGGGAEPACSFSTSADRPRYHLGVLPKPTVRDFNPCGVEVRGSRPCLIAQEGSPHCHDPPGRGLLLVLTAGCLAIATDNHVTRSNRHNLNRLMSGLGGR